MLSPFTPKVKKAPVRGNWQAFQDVILLLSSR
jgi:hypothetical protein